MNAFGLILAVAALLAFSLCFGATAIFGLRTGSLYYEPNCPPIRFRQRPVAFVSLLATYSVILLFLAIGIFKVACMLFAE